VSVSGYAEGEFFLDFTAARDHAGFATSRQFGQDAVFV
jgi:hypothetical protein